MTKFPVTAALAVAALLLSGSLASAQAPEAGNTPTATHSTPKKGRKSAKRRTARKRGTKKPAPATTPQ